MSETQTAIALPTSRFEDTGLGTIAGGTTELAPTAAAAAQQYEIQSAIVLARRFPRSEDEAFAKLMRACGRTSFAGGAAYAFPRGNQTVSGPSVTLAREAARIWGNIRYGLEIVRDDKDNRQIRGWAWDLETNTKVAAEDEFAKLVQRKKKGGGTEWLVPDERDLRELTNRRGAILIRNCILQLLPRDLIEDALDQSQVTLKDEATKDPDAARKRVLVAFDALNITAAMLQAYVGRPVGQCSPEEIAKLRTIYQSIKDGNSTWGDYVEGGNENGAQRVGTPTAKVEPPVVAPEAAAQPATDAPASSSDALSPATATPLPASAPVYLVPAEKWAPVTEKWHGKGAATPGEVKRLIAIGTQAGYSAQEIRAEVKAALDITLEEIPRGDPYALICSIFSVARPKA